MTYDLLPGGPAFPAPFTPRAARPPSAMPGAPGDERGVRTATTTADQGGLKSEPEMSGGETMRFDVCVCRLITRIND